jgi:hypothetical protein
MYHVPCGGSVSAHSSRNPEMSPSHPRGGCTGEKKAKEEQGNDSIKNDETPARRIRNMAWSSTTYKTRSMDEVGPRITLTAT